MASVSTLPHYRCPTCESAAVKPRNLIVFIDGTSNKPGDKNTNVVKLYQQVVEERRRDSELEQYCYYLEGIGVHDVDHLPMHKRLGMAVYSGLEMGIALNAGNNVKRAYRWLAERYQKGDQIYLFGFSRGAYQVRALASMIHEVGLAKIRVKEKTELAYHYYRAIDPYKPETRSNAIQFKKNYCWPGVRIHFLGVWDTVSSLGLVKEEVHVTASGSVTNACHFRHAIALDERRVKFMPEYFLEMNAHSSMGSPKSPPTDAKEVWFAGTHSDVGGTERSSYKVDIYPDDDAAPYSVHAGNVPLLWMRREAASKGLVFKPEEFTWDPEDVDSGTQDSMSFGWKIFEILPTLHQISFSGTGKHKRRSHLFCPRSVIPGQRIHTSVMSSDIYTPRASLGPGIYIPKGPRKMQEKSELWTTELPDENATTRLLASFLSDHQKTIEHLEKVLFILDFRLNNGKIPLIPESYWSEVDILKRSDFGQLVLIVIYDVTSNFNAPESLLKAARVSLKAILPHPDRSEFHRTLYILRFLAKHQTLRRHFVGHDQVVKALTLALERSTKLSTVNAFALISDSLCYLIHDNDLRGKVIRQFSVATDGTKAVQAMLSNAWETRSFDQLSALLRIITSLARVQQDLCKELEPKILELAENGKGLVGLAAVETLVALDAPLTPNVHISNIIGYLGTVLPPLDAEGGSDFLSDETDDFPSILLVNGSDKSQLDDRVMHELVTSIKSRDADERISATLALLKLNRYSIVRESSPKYGFLDVFTLQLEQEKTSLLAAYALRTCLKYNDMPMWKSNDFDFTRVAKFLVAMLDKGWFDDAIGRVEGCEIFRGLTGFAVLRKKICELDLVNALLKKLESGKRHEVRMSMLCLDILAMHDPLELTQTVTDNMAHLKDRDKNIRMKSIKSLTALAQTAVGEQAIMPHVKDIVQMLPPLDRQSVKNPEELGPVFLLHNLCRNEYLRKEIKASSEWRNRYEHYKQTRRRGSGR